MSNKTFGYTGPVYTRKGGAAKRGNTESRAVMPWKQQAWQQLRQVDRYFQSTN